MLRSFSRTAAVARKFSSHAALLNALVFRMPAMSPTMTEGGIVSWKFKPGELFSSGDVLLEVETDKATIDVEASDDGILWEVLSQDGATGVAVGKPIALLAEPGDDLSALERPNLDETSAEPPAEQNQEKAAESPKQEAPLAAKNATSQSLRAKSDSPSELVGKANPALRLTPAVEMLLHRNGISVDEAFAKIPASGPKGRLLRGDVMAYLGQIESSAVSKVAEYIKNKEHLDLSNIKIAPPKLATAEQSDSASASASAAKKPKPTNVMTIEFTSELGEDVSQEKFKYAFERALESAKRQTYGSRFPNYFRSPLASGIYKDDIFDDLLVAPVSKDRFEVSNITYKFVGGNRATGASGPADAFDDLLGFASAPSPAFSEAPASVSAVVSFQVKYDEKLVDSKDFVEFFQDSLLSQIPSKQLIIQQ